MQTRGQILHLFLHLPFVVSRDQPLSLSVQLVNFPNDIQTVSLDLDSLQAYLACFLDSYTRTVIRVAGSEFLSDFSCVLQLVLQHPRRQEFFEIFLTYFQQLLETSQRERKLQPLHQTFGQLVVSLGKLVPDELQRRLYVERRESFHSLLQWVHFSDLGVQRAKFRNRCHEYLVTSTDQEGRRALRPSRHYERQLLLAVATEQQGKVVGCIDVAPAGRYDHVQSAARVLPFRQIIEYSIDEFGVDVLLTEQQWEAVRPALPAEFLALDVDSFLYR